MLSGPLCTPSAPYPRSWPCPPPPPPPPPPDPGLVPQLFFSSSPCGLTFLPLSVSRFHIRLLIYLCFSPPVPRATTKPLRLIPLPLEPSPVVTSKTVIPPPQPPQSTCRGNSTLSAPSTTPPRQACLTQVRSFSYGRRLRYPQRSCPKRVVTYTQTPLSCPSQSLPPFLPGQGDNRRLLRGGTLPT